MSDTTHAPYRVLLTDDDENFSSLIRDVLGFAKDFNVRRAVSVREMWSFLEAGEYDVLLLDFQLPDGNGLDVLREIIRRQVEIPVVIITGRGDERTAAQAIQAGAIDYHVKSPETVFELPVLIRKAIRNFAFQTASKKSLEQIRYQALLLDNVRDAVVVWDRDGLITFWNSAAEELFETPASECIGKHVNALYGRRFTPPVPTDPPLGSTRTVERRLKTKDGREVWIGSRLTALLDGKKDTVAGYMDVTRDITQQKLGEMRLRERLDFENLITTISTEFINLPVSQIDTRIRAALETVGTYSHADRAYIFFFSEDGKRMSNTHEWAAPGVAPMRDSLQDLPIDDFPWFAEKIRSREILQVRHVGSLGEEARMEREEWLREGIGSLINLPMVFDQKVIGFLGFDTLQADREWSEDAVVLLKIIGEILLGAHMRQLAEERIHAAQAKLVESARLAGIGELAAGVAHQINNPLTAIIAESQMLQKGHAADTAICESAQSIERAGWKAQQAVQHLLEFSHPSAGGMAPIDINETIRHAVQMIGMPIQASHIQLEQLLAEDLPPVRGNTRQLEDLWSNLLLQARDAVSDGSPHFISVRSFRSGNGEVLVEVSDDGTLIPAGELDSIFEPHFAGAVAGRGSGMEFSICREIVRQHGGEIRASSSPDFGTIFRVTFTAEVGHGTGEHISH